MKIREVLGQISTKGIENESLERMSEISGHVLGEQLITETHPCFGKPSRVSEKPSRVSEKPSSVFAKHDDVFAKHDDVFAKHDDVFAKHDDVFAKHECVSRGTGSEKL